MIKLIKAKHSDSNFFLLLRNDRGNRKNSINQRLINPESHKIWFKKTLKSKKHLLFKILFNNKISCGYLRLERIKKKVFVSICVEAKFRKKNIASESLLESEAYLKNEKNIYSKVRTNNIGSKKLFTKIGYSIVKKNGKILTMKKKLDGLRVIDKIESIRGKNNYNWMNLLRLAYKRSPRETSIIMSKIYKDDLKISKLVKKLTK